MILKCGKIFLERKHWLTQMIYQCTARSGPSQKPLLYGNGMMALTFHLRSLNSHLLHHQMGLWQLVPWQLEPLWSISLSIYILCFHQFLASSQWSSSNEQELSERSRYLQFVLNFSFASHWEYSVLGWVWFKWQEKPWRKSKVCSIPWWPGRPGIFSHGSNHSL